MNYRIACEIICFASFFSVVSVSRLFETFDCNLTLNLAVLMMTKIVDTSIRLQNVIQSYCSFVFYFNRVC